MSELWNKTKLQCLQYRIAILWFILFSFNSLCTSIMAALTGTIWDNLNGQDKFEIVLAIGVNWTGTIMAFLSKASDKIQQKESSFEETIVTTKQQDVSNVSQTKSIGS